MRSSRSTATKRCSMSATALLAAACARGARRRACRRLAMRPASPSSVAEKNSVWRLAGHMRDDPVDGRAEAHVEHPVGLVEHERLHVVERERAALEEVLEAAGRGDEDVRALCLARLLLEADAAVDGGDREARARGDRAQLVDDLARRARASARAPAPPGGGRRARCGRRSARRRRASCRTRSGTWRARRDRRARRRSRASGWGRGVDAALREGAGNRTRNAEIGEGLL